MNVLPPDYFCDSSQIKFKNGQNYSIILDPEVAVGTDKEGFRVLEMMYILILVVFMWFFTMSKFTELYP